MASKAEIKRTKKKLKERSQKMPGKVMVKPKRLKKVARSLGEAKEILKNGRLPLEGLRQPLPPGWKSPKKVKEREFQSMMVPVLGDPVDGVRFTNGVNVNPALLAAIKAERDVKIAKKLAKAATSWYRKLFALEEIRMVKEFQIGDDVWWTKKGKVIRGRVIRLKTRKLVIDPEPWDPNEERVVLPVRKVKKGQVPKEYLHPDNSRWRIGRMAA